MFCCECSLAHVYRLKIRDLGKRLGFLQVKYHMAGEEKTERRFSLCFKFWWTASGLRNTKMT